MADQYVYAFLQQPAGRWNGIKARVIQKVPAKVAEAAQAKNPHVYFHADEVTATAQLQQYERTITKRQQPLPSIQRGIFKDKLDAKKNGTYPTMQPIKPAADKKAKE